MESGEVFDLGYCNIYFEQPHLVMVKFTKDTDVDEPVAVEILSALIKLTKGEPHALIYDFNKKNIIIREISRKISGVRDERTANLVCRAFIAPSLQNKLESKHYIQSGKPAAHTNYFNKKTEAIAWAREKVASFLTRGK
jgi:hypothetical protein